MKNMDILSKVAERARMESAPEIDVSGEVMALIYQQDTAASRSFMPLTWFAVASGALAILCMGLALFLGNLPGEPLFDIFSAMTWGMI